MKIAKIFFTVALVIVSILAFHYVLAAAGIMTAALFTPSPIMNELRKKAGSDVFSKNHYGAFIRKRVKGTNPKSTKQLNVRAGLTSLAKAWKGLTDAQRLGWTSYGTSAPQKNRLGQSIIHTGLVWFQRLNRILQTVGSAVIDDAPSSSAIPPPLMSTPAVTAVSGVSVGVTTGLALTAPALCMIYMSKPMSQGRVYNSNYRFLYAMTPADAMVKDLTALYTACFGRVPVSGEKIFAKFEAVDSTTGLRNQAQAVTLVVA
jgi:hypothetical protein